LFLNLKEMQEIKKYFKKLGRNPLTASWRPLRRHGQNIAATTDIPRDIEYEEEGRTRTIDNLLKNTIMKVTNELKKRGAFLVFKDNAGIIRFEKKINICFKGKTHNHRPRLSLTEAQVQCIGGL